MVWTATETRLKQFDGILMTVKSPVIVALDYPDAGAALEMAAKLSPDACRVKVGKELFTAAGPALVEKLVGQGFDVFLDLKFHDIPNTVAGAVSAAAKLGVWMVNVHAGGGRRMMEAAANAVAKQSHKPLLIGVTVLTSMAEEDLRETGVTVKPEDQVSRLARMAKASGLDGVVSSAEECPRIRKECGDDFVLVTPGIRPASSVADDQRRVVTPLDALRKGSDYLVIGRPVTQSSDPLATLAGIDESIATGISR